VSCAVFSNLIAKENLMKLALNLRFAAALVLLLAASAQAADWSDTSIAYRTGNSFAEPFIDQDIRKDILSLTHVSGYKLGTNFFNLDYLASNSKDPSSMGSSNGAQEFYLLYRHTLELSKLTGHPYAFGPVKDLGLTAGFDLNTKNDAGYNSKKRMFVLGPTLLMDVPGFLNISLLALKESNAPYSTFSGISTPRYSYDTHAMISAAWGIPLGASGFTFEGFVNLITAKGKDEFGGDTKPETNLDMQVMYDMSRVVGAKLKTFKLGLQYQYWKNKFGNDSSKIVGATAKTPMLRAEYHF
jgi:nucleoside-specific outer membrane channel protein Tsx